VNRSQSAAEAARTSIILIGYRGCGKTAVGRELACRLRRPFIDTDEEIERRSGQSIRDLFQTRGEPAFRRLERDLIREVVRRRRCVISVGGGAVLDDDNVARLRSAGVCIWLTAAPEELLRRMVADPDNAARRPPLTDSDPLEEVRALLAQRTPRYESLADHTVPTDGRTPQQVVEVILDLLARSRTTDAPA